MKQTNNNEGRDDARNAVNWTMTLLTSMGRPVEVFIRRDFGFEYPGPCGLWGLLILIASATMISSARDAMPLLVFTGLYLVRLFTIRIGNFLRPWRRFGDQVAGYSGNPLLCLLLPRVDEMTIRRFVEPLVVAAFAIGCLEWMRSLGFYLLAAAISLFLVNNLAFAAWRRQMLRMHDAVLAARMRAESYRSLQSSDWN